MTTKRTTLGDEVYAAGQDVRDLRRIAERSGNAPVATLLMEAEDLLAEATDMLLDEEDQ